MKITAEPRSDQWNADDFVGGPRAFTIAGVKVGAAEQKYDIELVEGEGRVWRPPLTVLRLLIAAWGDEASAWAGKRVRLYRDPSIRFGADQVGGIRVSHMSHLPGDRPLKVMLTETRGRRKAHSVEPLPDEPTATTGPTTEQVDTCTDVDVLSAMWKVSGPEMRARIEARATALKAQAAPDGPMVTRPESEGTDPWAQSGESLLDQGAGS